MSAYHGDPSMKAALLAGLAAGEDNPLTARQADEATRVAWAEELGLSAPVVLLGAHLAIRFDGADEGKVFARDLLAAIEPGADIAAAPHSLILWAWESAPEALRALMHDADYLGAGAEVAALHDRAVAGEDVARSEWRAARARLGRLGDGEDDQAGAAAAMAASAWDFRAAPGAVVDLFIAWQNLLAARIGREEGWGEAERAGVHELIREQKAAAQARLGPTPEEADKDAAEAHERRVTEAMIAALEHLDDPRLRRHMAVNARIAAAASALRKEGAEALLFLLRASAATEEGVKALA